MNLNEIVGEVIQRCRRRMIAEFAGEPVAKPCIPAHLRSDRPVLALDETGRDVFGIGIATNAAFFNPDALCGRVACFILRGFTVDFLQYRVVHKPGKGAVNRFDVRFMAVTGNLHPILQATRQIIDKVFRRVKICEWVNLKSTGSRYSKQMSRIEQIPAPRFRILRVSPPEKRCCRDHRSQCTLSAQT